MSRHQCIKEELATKDQVIANSQDVMRFQERIIQTWVDVSKGPVSSVPDDMREDWKKSEPFFEHARLEQEKIETTQSYCDIRRQADGATGEEKERLETQASEMSTRFQELQDKQQELMQRFVRENERGAETEAESER